MQFLLRFFSKLTAEDGGTVGKNIDQQAVLSILGNGFFAEVAGDQIFGTKGGLYCFPIGYNLTFQFFLALTQAFLLGLQLVFIPYHLLRLFWSNVSEWSSSWGSEYIFHAGSKRSRLSLNK